MHVEFLSMDHHLVGLSLRHGHCQHKVGFQGSGEWDLHPKRYGEEGEAVAGR